MQIVDREHLLERARASPAIAAITPLLSAFDGEVFLVGGTVRDLLLGRPALDVDLAVSADPLPLAARIGQVSDATRFATVSATRAGHRYDIARTRRERYPRPGALPEVEPAGIEEDLARRDFTVNALALRLCGARAGELLAADGAVEDLRAGRLAVLHDRSFQDDPTRLLRLARYTSRLGFGVAPGTRALASAAAENGALATLSGPRLGHELRLLAAEPDPVAAYEAVAALGLPWRIDAALARRALAVLPSDGRPDRVVLACVLASRPADRCAAELDRLGFPAADRSAILEGAGADEVARRLAAATTGAGIAEAVGTAGVETVALAYAHGAGDAALRWLRELRHARLQISGDDLIARGVPEGPAVGRALRAARAALLDAQAPDRATQLRVALRAAE